MSSKSTDAFENSSLVTISSCEFFNKASKPLDFIASLIIYEENNSPKLTILSEVFADNSLIKNTPSNVFSSVFSIFLICPKTPL